MNFKEQLRKTISIRMKLLGHSYADVAKLTQQSRQAVHQAMNAEKVSVDRLIDLATAYGLEVTLNINEKMV
jgi:hypothetical protein